MALCKDCGQTVAWGKTYIGRGRAVWKLYEAERTGSGAFIMDVTLDAHGKTATRCRPSTLRHSCRQLPAHAQPIKPAKRPVFVQPINYPDAAAMRVAGEEIAMADWASVQRRYRTQAESLRAYATLILKYTLNVPQPYGPLVSGYIDAGQKIIDAFDVNSK